MSYSVHATTPSGPIRVHSSYVPEIRHVIADARDKGARDVTLTCDGKPIDELELGKLTRELVEKSTMTKFA